MTSDVEKLVEHLKDCVGVDAAIVQHRGSADDLVERLLADGWTWDERPSEIIAGKRIRYLRPPNEETESDGSSDA